MSKRRREPMPDPELKAALNRAAEAGVPRSAICKEAGVDQSTLWKWVNGRSSPVMSSRQAVLDAIEKLVSEAS